MGVEDVDPDRRLALRGIAHGAALLANDPHMAHRVPATWIRNELRWGERFAVGVTIPGVPGLGLGSNGHLAWGFTNAVLDQEDLWALAPSEEAELEERIERLRVRGGEDEELVVREDARGPVVGVDPEGRPLVYEWNVLRAERVDLDLFEMLLAEELEPALDLLAGWWGSSFNAVVVDRAGRIGWTVTGYVPARRDGAWSGPLDEAQRPRVVDPAGGLLVSANQRPVPEAGALSRLWLAPDRAARIAELLEREEPFDERALLAVQLDERSPVHVRWLPHFEEARSALELDGERAALAARVEAWDGRAALDSVAFRLLRRFRLRAHQALLGPLLAPCAVDDPGFVYEWTLAEEAVARLLEERAAHLLSPAHPSYTALLASALGEAFAGLEQEGGGERPWGEDNRARFTHPLSLAVPALGRWLDWPEDPLPGSATSVRASDPDWGAALRLVVSPGREAQGLLHVTGGVSGHFLSPHYADGHADWVSGRPTPLLAGLPVHVLQLRPPAP